MLITVKNRNNSLKYMKFYNTFGRYDEYDPNAIIADSPVIWVQ